MKKNEKKLILVLLILLAIVVGIKINRDKKRMHDNNSNNTSAETQFSENQKDNKENVEYLEDGTKLNTSKTFSKERKIGDYKFTNIALADMEGSTMFFANVQNITQSNIEMKDIIVKLLDNDGNVITKFTGLINSLEPGATTQVSVGITADFANAYDFDIEIIN